MDTTKAVTVTRKKVQREFKVPQGTTGEDFLKLLRQTFALKEDAIVWLEDDAKAVLMSPGHTELQAGMTYVLMEGRGAEAGPQHVGDGLVQGLSKGISSTWGGLTSFVSKPVEGARTGGGYGFIKGLGAGTVDLTKGVVGGTCDVVTNTLEGVRNTPDAVADFVENTTGIEREKGKFGLAGEEKGRLLESTLTVDESQPAHLGEGLVVGVTSLGKGVVGGLSDLAYKPVQGAQREGAFGFIKGIGQGLTGATTKTLAGTLDAANALTTGLKNTGDTVQHDVAIHGGGVQGVAGATTAAVSDAAQKTQSALTGAVSGVGNLIGGKSSSSTDTTRDNDLLK